MRPATAQPLKLEVGRSYRTRDGRKAVITSERYGARDDNTFKFAGVVDGEKATCWNGLGFVLNHADTPLDLISEWDAPDAEGWIQWSGGECPVPPETVVDLRWTFGGQDDCWIARSTNWQVVRAYRIVTTAPATPKQEQPVDEKMTIECLFECFASWSDARQAGDKEGMKKAAAEAQRFLDGMNGDLAQPLALALRGLLDDISVSGWLGKAATLREATEAMERAKAAGVV